MTEFDKTRRNLLISVIIITSLLVAGSFVLSVRSLVLIFPAQFLITYFGFCRGVNSSKNYNESFSYIISNLNFILVFVCTVLALAYENHAKVASVFLLSCPLILTRLVIFVRGLPLSALYPFFDRILE